MSESNQLQRHCLVTVGATVGFPELTKTVLHPEFWKHLQSKGFTSLRVQCGPDTDWASSQLQSESQNIPSGMNVEVFESSKNLMKEEMTLCKAVPGKATLGLVISHAGTGTILDAWKAMVPIVVVPNTSLLDNHQYEMAQYLAEEGYATRGTPDRSDLQGAVDKAQLLSEECRDGRLPQDPKASSSPAEPRVSVWQISPKEAHSQMVHD